MQIRVENLQKTTRENYEYRLCENFLFVNRPKNSLEFENTSPFNQRLDYKISFAKKS